MKNLIKENKNKIVAGLLSFGAFFPNISFAALVLCDNVTKPCDFNALVLMINEGLKWFVGMSATIAAITFSIAGAKILLNPESDSERTAAKEMFVKTFWGLVLVLGSWLIINTVISTLVDPNIRALRFLNQINQ